MPLNSRSRLRRAVSQRPTAFETRNVGDTLEFETVLGEDGRTCDLNFVPQHVGLLGFREIGGDGR